jgi:hypothetical protein
MAASARPFARATLGRFTFRIRYRSVYGLSGVALGISRSLGSSRPPGNTNLPGMNLCA